MKGRRVAIPSVGRNFDDGTIRLIKGRRYEVIDEDDSLFKITAETGTIYYCSKGINQCAHLDYNGSWKLLTERK